MPSNYPTEFKYRPLSQSDLPDPLLKRLNALNIHDVERFLDLADTEFTVLQKILSISEIELNQYIQDVRQKYKIFVKTSHTAISNSSSVTNPLNAARVEDMHSYEETSQKALKSYNKKIIGLPH